MDCATQETEDVRMKDISLVDQYGEGTVRMCERCFKKYRNHLNKAQMGGLSYQANTVKQRGCIMCSRSRIGSSPWSGDMFMIWRGFKRAEENEDR